MSKYKYFIKLIFYLSFFLLSSYARSQNDSILPYPNLLFDDPQNFNQNIFFNSEISQYIFQNQIGNIQIKRPTYMSKSIYNDWFFQKKINDYWKSRINSKRNATLLGSDKEFSVGGESFNRIFGGNTVDIRPQGAAELTFSGNFDKTKNPNLTEIQQNNANFNFDQSIQMNVIGKIGTKLTLRTNYDTQSQFDFPSYLFQNEI